MDHSKRSQSKTSVQKSKDLRPFRIGTAAWTIPKDFKDLFEPEGSHLERYALGLNAVEINTSFYRHHRPATYERWSASVPDDFQFSVKLSKIFTHEQKLVVDKAELNEVLAGPLALGVKLGVILVQLPPSLQFDAKVFERFVKLIRKTYSGGLVCEPRHRTWLDTDADSVSAKKKSGATAADLFAEYSVGHVIADPDPFAPVKGERTYLERLAELTGHSAEAASRNHSTQGSPIYLRLHGSPQIYKSDYEKADLLELGKAMIAGRAAGAKASALATTSEMALASAGPDIWCIFDNTTFGFATRNAVDLKKFTAT